jgi:hypothetical protein
LSLEIFIDNIYLNFDRIWPHLENVYSLGTEVAVLPKNIFAIIDNMGYFIELDPHHSKGFLSGEIHYSSVYLDISKFIE